MTDDVDVAIIGGGLAGCLAAASLAKQGRRVRVIDRFADPHDEFRAEQIIGEQVDQFRQRGLLDHLTPGAQIATETVNASHGRIIDRTHIQQLGASYGSMVRAARALLPSDSFHFGKAAKIETSPAVQKISFANGCEIAARLVILATGLSLDLSQALGIEQIMLSEDHSLTIGFDVESSRRFPQGLSWVYYGERLKDRIDYLALFTLGDKLRANLFCYQQRGSDWVRRLRENPGRELEQALPGLFRLLGPLKVSPKLQVRSNDLRQARSASIPGVVLIGDAFQTPCPAAGTGIDRILSDVAALERWLAPASKQAAFDAPEIENFYRDPHKLAVDAECLRIARYRRAVSTETTMRWSLHRWRVMMRRRLRARLADVKRRREPSSGLHAS